MIRTWSLLLRTARRTGYVVAGRQDATPLSEHTFIMHPVEAGEPGSIAWAKAGGKPAFRACLFVQYA